MHRPLDVVVIGSGANALGALRSLGSAGLRTALVSSKPGDPAARSRYARQKVISSLQDLAAARLSLALQLDGHRPMLLLTGELEVAACLSSLEEWQEYFLTYFFTPGIARTLLSKAGFHGLAMQAGAPVPRTWVIADVPSLSQIDLGEFPLIVKPVRRDSRYTARFARAYRVCSEQALRTRAEELLDTGIEGLVVQEWIAGEDSDIYFNFLFVDRNGALRTSFVGRKVLCWPHMTGGTASCMAAPEHHQELTALSLEFLEKVGFCGLIGIEYKFQRKSGRFFMIEPTVYRTDHQHEVASLNGCNLLLDAWNACKSNGESTLAVQAPYQNKYYWVDSPSERYSASEARFGRAVYEGARRVDAWFRWTDPLPGLRHHGAYAVAKVRSAFSLRTQHETETGKV